LATACCWLEQAHRRRGADHRRVSGDGVVSGHYRGVYRAGLYDVPAVDVEGHLMGTASASAIQAIVLGLGARTASGSGSIVRIFPNAAMRSICARVLHCARSPTDWVLEKEGGTTNS
jgi:hypothetical protein